MKQVTTDLAKEKALSTIAQQVDAIAVLLELLPGPPPPACSIPILCFVRHERVCRFYHDVADMLAHVRIGEPEDAHIWIVVQRTEGIQGR